MATIDLGQYRSHGSHVFAGRDRGKEVRKEAGLERLDEEDEGVTVEIPEDTLSINSSFFLGLFGPSIRKLGPEGFRHKYAFEGPILDDVIEDGIDEALPKDSPLR